MLAIRVLSLFLVALAVHFPARADTRLPAKQWIVDGAARSALVSIPLSATTQPTPVLFVFHGHGGSAQNMAARQYHTLWPEAIVVYPQGLPTSGIFKDPWGREPGWQVAPYLEFNRDVRFFDAMLASLRKDYRIDDKRIYITGFSNGGGLVYVLWALRSSVLAGVAPTSYGAIFVPAWLLTPKPALIAGGINDRIVKFAWQQSTIDAVRKMNQCDAGQPAGPNTTIYPSATGNPLVTCIFPRGHTQPPEVVALIVKFFRDGMTGLNPITIATPDQSR